MQDYTEVIDKLIELVKISGVTGVIVLAVILLVHKPERITALKACVFFPVYRLFKVGSRNFIGAKVGSSVTTFLKEQLKELHPQVTRLSVRLRWVKSADDPILKKDGTIIIRMQESDDQTRNLLTAARHAIPLVVCKMVRNSVGRHVVSAIDLTLLRKFVETIGKNAQPVFQKYFLVPESENDQRVAQLFQKLVEIDDRGYFVTIFFQELEYLGNRLYSIADLEDKTPEVIRFIEYLLTIARRNVGESIKLIYQSQEFSLGVIFVALSEKAKAYGIEPYTKRIDMDIREGCDTIYLVAFSKQFAFLRRILRAVEGDFRILVERRHRVIYRSKARGDEPDIMEMAVLKRLSNATNPEFARFVEVSELKEGNRATGIVQDVADEVAIVDVNGFLCRIELERCAWAIPRNCADVLAEGKQYVFLIEAIDHIKHRVELTRRLPEDDPWQAVDIPDEGHIIDIAIDYMVLQYLAASTSSGIQVLIPCEEILWSEADQIDAEALIGSKSQVRIIAKDIPSRRLIGSIRQLSENPWPLIERQWPRGTKLRAEVIDVSAQNVRVRLPGGLTGLIAASRMKAAGYEFVDFEQTVVPGQKLDVFVVDIYPRKGRVRLDLERNRQISSIRGHR